MGKLACLVGTFLWQRKRAKESLSGLNAANAAVETIEQV
jgi:hypothetical protein